MDHKHSNHDVDKDRQSAAPGMRVEDLLVAFEEEQAIADMISEGSPVVPPGIVGEKAPSTPTGRTR